MLSETNNSETDILMLIKSDESLNYGCRKQDKKLNLPQNKKPIHKKQKAKQFTLQEDQLLLLQVIRIGKRFEAIARNFPRRSKHELKNRYYTHLRDRENEIFDSKSLYYLSQETPKKNKNPQTDKHDLRSQLENVGMEEEYKVILEKFIGQVCDLFSFIKSFPI
ncbi:unnamed protein product [Paramecium pentaurelia]|uniref:HTH myb-type domain-containing protein n=1 Tax=Paramecium pentaurelia TaxID=43138 RepID=A0A8S1RXJ8_9CILI|nr:unnamed protein product [Paramecium pentaurelia]